MNRESLKLPWRGRAPQPLAGMDAEQKKNTIVVGSDDRPVNTPEQKTYAITAANNYLDALDRLRVVEGAYVRQTRLLKRRRKTTTDPKNSHQPTSAYILEQLYASAGIRAENWAYDPDPSGCTTTPHKVLPDPLNGPNMPIPGAGWYKNLMEYLDVWENAFPKAPLGEYDPNSCFKTIRQTLERHIGPPPPEPDNPEAQQLDLLEAAGRAGQ